MCNAHNHSVHCDRGFGGDGHLGGGGVRSYIEVNGSRTTWRLASESFCRPTYCPKCYQPVYFVRHNGGSVWFDELGQPWPKHGCFADEYSYSRIHSQLHRDFDRVASPLFGLVVEVEGLSDGQTYRITVKCEDDHLVTAYMTGSGEQYNLVGELVTLSRHDHVILHPYLPTATRFEFPNTAEAHYNIGNIYFRLDCIEDAKEEFKHAVQLDDQHRDAWYSFAQTYSRVRSKYMPGSHERQKARIAIVRAYAIAAELFFEAKQYEAALDSYKQVRFFDPDYPNLYSQMGLILRRLGKHEEAIQTLKQAGVVAARNITPNPASKTRR